ncbi:hypothetical protein [Streptomyces sp. 4F14]|uniref:hypothetical protein n=1 Tax=Streptomyces sp. 4F14 TaxID=3394380 RepID=UPI003A83FDEB
MTRHPHPDQIEEVYPAYAVPPPALPWTPTSRLTTVERELPQRAAPRGRRVRRRARRLLREDAFWSGVLTALSVATLVAVIAATAA